MEKHVYIQTKGVVIGVDTECGDVSLKV